MKQITRFTKDMIGKKISCVIEHKEINDAEIQFEKGSFFILQNLKEGNYCENRNGYAFSWKVTGGDENALNNEGVCNIRLRETEIINTYDIF